jgi:hypothetical protein
VRRRGNLAGVILPLPVEVERLQPAAERSD